MKGAPLILILILILLLILKIAERVTVTERETERVRESERPPTFNLQPSIILNRQIAEKADAKSIHFLRPVPVHIHFVERHFSELFTVFGAFCFEVLKTLNEFAVGFFEGVFRIDAFEAGVIDE